MPVATQTGGATVIALKTKRKSARAGKRRDALARALVAAWSGLAMLTSLLIVATVGGFILRHGLTGLGIALAIASIAGWAIAGRLVRRRTPDTEPRDLRVTQRGSR